ncbi:unnamed protein product, partial [Allacma fusca]
MLLLLTNGYSFLISEYSPYIESTGIQKFEIVDLTPILMSFPPCFISFFQLSKNLIATISLKIQNPVKQTSQGKRLFTDDTEGVHFITPKLVWTFCLVVVTSVPEDFGDLLPITAETMIFGNVMAVIVTRSTSTHYTDITFIRRLNSIPFFFLK